MVLIIVIHGHAHTETREIQDDGNDNTYAISPRCLITWNGHNHLLSNFFAAKGDSIRRRPVVDKRA